ncbi:hypothetical protein K440DRAFT_371864 [Wilcoxina mikolae CBS 423.85]|nr:hypothetical protein K440DRAFT_371864 [Wilcoxina mikolae CBS 423.85]
MRLIDCDRGRTIACGEMGDVTMHAREASKAMWRWGRERMGERKMERRETARGFRVSLCRCGCWGFSAASNQSISIYAYSRSVVRQPGVVGTWKYLLLQRRAFCVLPLLFVPSPSLLFSLLLLLSSTFSPPTFTAAPSSRRRHSPPPHFLPIACVRI